VRIGATSGNPATLTPVAFRNANGKFVAVIRTQTAATFAVTGLPTGTYGVNYSIQTQYNIDVADVTVSAGSAASVSIPGKGVITLYQR
jgi:hypothetical protein